MEIRLPSTVKDLRLKHFKVLTNEKYKQAMDIFDLVDFLAEFMGEKKSKILQIDKSGIEKMYIHIAKLYASFKPSKKPPIDIVLDGQSFSLINPEKVGIGWHMDYTTADIKVDPIRLACLLYYPTGKVYGETDINDNLLYPIKDRYELIANHLPLTTFLEASGFFLNRQAESIKVYQVANKILKFLPKRKLKANSNGNQL